MLHIDPLGPSTPRLPERRSGALTPVVASTALHLAFVVIMALLGTAPAPGSDARRREAIDREGPDVRQIVFLAPRLPGIASGGGGGGNQQAGPIRRAQGVGDDAITLRVRSRPAAAAPVTASSAPAADDIPQLPSIVLDAKPLASGLFEQIGLPGAGLTSATSTGKGSGGGIGTGSGTGIGSGRGAGLGPGSGGGAGGGTYRVGGAVSAPRLITQVRPKYTTAALRNRLQGTVVLEAVVTADGCTSEIRVVRSLDAGGLDEEAVAAVAQWRFEPGRLGRTPVDVLVTILVDFFIR